MFDLLKNLVNEWYIFSNCHKWWQCVPLLLLSALSKDYESLHFPLGAASAQSPGIAGQDPLHSTSPSQVQGLVQGSALRQLSASSSAPSLVSGTSVLPELIGALEISSELSSGHSQGRRVTESRQVQRHDVISGSSGVEQLRRLMTESVIHTQQSKEKEVRLCTALCRFMFFQILFYCLIELKSQTICLTRCFNLFFYLCRLLFEK